jgi:hypothetical protein
VKKYMDDEGKMMKSNNNSINNCGGGGGGDGGVRSNKNGNGIILYRSILKAVGCG